MYRYLFQTLPEDFQKVISTKLTRAVLKNCQKIDINSKYFCQKCKKKENSESSIVNKSDYIDHPTQAQDKCYQEIVKNVDISDACIAKTLDIDCALYSNDTLP